MEAHESNKGGDCGGGGGGGGVGGRGGCTSGLGDEEIILHSDTGCRCCGCTRRYSLGEDSAWRTVAGRRSTSITQNFKFVVFLEMLRGRAAPCLVGTAHMLMLEVAGRREGVLQAGAVNENHTTL